MDKLQHFYAKFRSSRDFLWLLLAFVASWLGFHWLFGLDKDLGGYNGILSTEASINTTILTLMFEQQSSRQDARDAAMEDLLRKVDRIGDATLVVVETIRDTMQAHTEMLRMMQEHDQQLLNILRQQVAHAAD